MRSRRSRKGPRRSGICEAKNVTKISENALELYDKPLAQLHPGFCAGGSSRTNGSRYPPLGARRGLPKWPQPASSTSPWLFYQVSSEVFSKSSSVMSSLFL